MEATGSKVVQSGSISNAGNCNPSPSTLISPTAEPDAPGVYPFTDAPGVCPFTDAPGVYPGDGSTTETGLPPADQTCVDMSSANDADRAELMDVSRLHKNMFVEAPSTSATEVAGLAAQNTIYDADTDTGEDDIFDDTSNTTKGEHIRLGTTHPSATLLNKRNMVSNCWFTIQTKECLLGEERSFCGISSTVCH